MLFLLTKSAEPHVYKKFYVYGLCDPRDELNRPFYIGKGCGNRLTSHENEVRRGTSKNPVKRDVIKDIWEAGLRINYCIFARFDDEAKAFSHERHLIGLFNPKANIAHGTTKIVTFFGMISEMCRTSRDTREEFKRRFPRKAIEQVYPPEMVRLYDAILTSPRFSTLESASGSA